MHFRPFSDNIGPSCLMLASLLARVCSLETTLFLLELTGTNVLISFSIATLPSILVLSLHGRQEWKRRTPLKVLAGICGGKWGDQQRESRGWSKGGNGGMGYGGGLDLVTCWLEGKESLEDSRRTQETGHSCSSPTLLSF